VICDLHDALALNTGPSSFSFSALSFSVRTTRSAQAQGATHGLHGDGIRHISQLR
jgi:hypothetical protein